MLIYAYGFDVTKVTLEKFRQKSRAKSRIRVTRALAKPEIIEFDTDDTIYEQPIYVPCSQDGTSLPEPDTSGSYLVITPACNDPGQIVLIEGFNFIPNIDGPLVFVPDSEFGIFQNAETVQVDGDGQFSLDYELPERPSEVVQHIRVTQYAKVGPPLFTQTAKDTWDKIIETVFLALLATTLGTFLAIPISFLAARNLMSDVKSPLSSIALSVLGWPLGLGLGILIAQWVSDLSQSLTSSISLNAAGVVVVPVGIVAAIRWAMPQEERDNPTLIIKILRIITLIIAGFLSVLSFYLIGHLGMSLGDSLDNSLGSFNFLANFIFQIGDILVTITILIAALVGGSVISGILGKLGQNLSEQTPEGGLRIINLVTASSAGAALFGIIAYGINWLYEFTPLEGLTGIGKIVSAFQIPILIGVLLGAALALFSKPKEVLPTGITIYFITRMLLNAIRSVEPLVMVIVAVIWVGIGPFAGVLALALHTIAALAKLYSEQVESIQPGPLEAITATGANRLQTIVYAVVPQIIPPYISFTMYRWDINVRMSTIIGFAGGGGIGFLLQQNINLLHYRAASVQMLAIAVVVASMDFISSTLRERVV